MAKRFQQNARQIYCSIKINKLKNTCNTMHVCVIYMMVLKICFKNKAFQGQNVCLRKDIRLKMT